MTTPSDISVNASRRSAREQPLRYGPLEARRTAFSVALAIFWRMRSEVRQPGNRSAWSRQARERSAGPPADLERAC
jgi:hypothetical protein